MLFLELARRQRGWSQRRLGDHPNVRIDRNFISLVERGLALPIPTQAERLARALGVAPARLLEEVPGVQSDLRGANDEVVATP